MDDVEGDYMERRSHLRFVSRELRRFSEELAALEQSMSSKAPSPTTVASTPEAPSDAAVPASTTQSESTSLPLGTQTDGAGPAGRFCTSAHQWVICYLNAGKVGWQEPIELWEKVLFRCMECDASLEFVRTPAPAAAPATWTSPRQASSQPVGRWPEASAPSPSASASDICHCGHPRSRHGTKYRGVCDHICSCMGFSFAMTNREYLVPGEGERT
jgi:hypothetical protein